METTNKNHSLDITYFTRNVRNFIANNPTWTGVINLEGKTKVKGIELVYTGKLTKDLNAYANYTYTQTKDSKGIELIRRPKHTANVGLAYQVTEKLGTNANISYVGKRTDDYYGPAPSYTQYKGVKLPSYTLVNIGANYQLTDNVNIYLNLNNLFDKKYESITRYGQDGRNVYVGLKGSF